MPSRIENLISRTEAIAPSLATTLYDAQAEFSRADKPKKVKHDSSIEALVFHLLEMHRHNPALVLEQLQDIERACETTLNFILELVTTPPKNQDVCARNPKHEIPQLARILVSNMLAGQSAPVVVPVCPDIDQYRLHDGLGEVIPKALEHIQVLSALAEKNNVPLQFDIQVADVEGLDPIMLHNTGETTETHFQKTAETLRKTQEKIAALGQANITASSMNAAFLAKNRNYQEEQAAAARHISKEPTNKIRLVVDALLMERKRVKDFETVPEANQYELVVAELAGYTAYGNLINGEAIILSPDAMSAVPAYHFGAQTPKQYSPVLYAK